MKFKKSLFWSGAVGALVVALIFQWDTAPAFKGLIAPCRDIRIGDSKAYLTAFHGMRYEESAQLFVVYAPCREIAHYSILFEKNSIFSRAKLIVSPLDAEDTAHVRKLAAFYGIPFDGWAVSPDTGTYSAFSIWNSDSSAKLHGGRIARHKFLELSLFKVRK